MANDVVVKFLTGSLVTRDDPAAARAAHKAQAAAVATLLAGHIGGARQSISIAIYDFRLDEPEATTVLDAINARASAGVLVRVAYFDQASKRPVAEFQARGGDPAPAPDLAFLARLHSQVQKKAISEADVARVAASVQKKPIAGGGHLMHHKYVIVDEMSPAASVWTGSANFTTDAWTLQDNNIVIVPSQALAGLYATDFGELWDSGRIAGTGLNDVGTASVDGMDIDADFAPGEGATIDSLIAMHVAAASHRVVIASMVISSAAVLGALSDALDRGVAVSGIYDGPQMQGVANAWKKSARSAGTLALWEQVRTSFVAKASEPYTDAGAHNFMHNKCMTVDGRLVVTGSFNFSQNATRNAENVLTLHDPKIAGDYETYIAQLVRRYG
jgi:phosphatidylserine/phosphatidylglycerophosphate/cardiolipin synthase-like enzyme